MSQEFIDAVTQGDVAKVKEMLSAEPSLAQTRDQNGVSVIMKALYYGKRDVVAELLASGVQLDVFQAAATGQADQLRALIAKDPSLVNTYSPDGFTPLGLAAFFGQADTLNALLAAGAQVNAPSREAMKMSPLGSALAVQRNDLARTLIEHGADVNAKAANDLTPLHTAAARGNLESAKLLLDHGAHPNPTSTDGKTPISYAEERNHPEMVEFLSAIVSGT